MEIVDYSNWQVVQALVPRAPRLGGAPHLEDIPLKKKGKKTKNEKKGTKEKKEREKTKEQKENQGRKRN